MRLLSFFRAPWRQRRLVPPGKSLDDLVGTPIKLAVIAALGLMILVMIYYVGYVSSLRGVADNEHTRPYRQEGSVNRLEGDAFAAANGWEGAAPSGARSLHPGDNWQDAAQKHGYAFETDNAPMVALIIDDLGISRHFGQRAIAMPVPLTVSILPYGPHNVLLADQARERGHDVLVHLPMEPVDPNQRPGPMALRVRHDAEDITARLFWNLGQFPGYVGVNNHMGSKFTRWDQGMRLVLAEAKRRGLLYIDSLTTPDSVATRIAADLRVPTISRDVFLDNENGAEYLSLRLTETQNIARDKGWAVAIAHPSNTTLTALEMWIPHISRNGFRFVTISTLAEYLSRPGIDRASNSIAAAGRHSPPER